MIRVYYVGMVCKRKLSSAMLSAFRIERNPSLTWGLCFFNVCLCYIRLLIIATEYEHELLDQCNYN